MTARTSHDVTGADRPPGALAVRTVRLAVLALPRGRTRDRYRDEYLAELWSIPADRRTRHLLGITRTVVPLALAVRRAARSHWRDLVGPRPARPLLCLLNVRHRWTQQSTEDGNRFSVCSRCGKDFPVRDAREGSDESKHRWVTWLGIGS